MRSPNFAVVQSAESAEYVVQIEADDMDTRGRSLDGFLRVRERESGEVSYSRQIGLDNITSTGALRA